MKKIKWVIFSVLIVIIIGAGAGVWLLYGTKTTNPVIILQ